MTQKTASNEGFFSALLPTVFINRIIISNGTLAAEKVADDPHIDIPSKEEFDWAFKGANEGTPENLRQYGNSVAPDSNSPTQDPSLDINPTGAGMEG